MSTSTERELPLFPLERVVLFPGMLLPLYIFEERYKVMIGSCQVTDQLFGVLLIHAGREVGAPATPERVGCTARMVRLDRLPDGRMSLLAVGEHRFRLMGPARVAPEGYLTGQVSITSQEPPAEGVRQELVGEVIAEFERYRAAMRPAGPAGAAGGGEGGSGGTGVEKLAGDPVRLSFVVGAGLAVAQLELQFLLELDDVGTRLERELALLRRENRLAQQGAPFSLN